MVVTTAAGVWVGSSRKAPRKRAVPSWTAKPTRLWAPRMPRHQLAIGGVEVEVPGELLLRWGRRRSGRSAPAARRTGSGSTRRAELRTFAAGRAWTKDQAHTPCKSPMRNSTLCDKFRTPAGAGGMKLGYARVSTEDQRLDLQRTRLTEAGCGRLFEEKVSGAARQRPALEQLLRELRADDVLVVTRLDRLARSTAELLRIAEAIAEQRCGITVA